jgi:hypothetical protein
MAMRTQIHGAPLARLVLSLAWVFLLGALALAQTITGRISGTVTDLSGAVLPGVVVRITNEATTSSRTVTTDGDGFYVATNLPVGDYSLTVEHQGFKKSTKTGYNLITDGRLTVDFALEAGAVTEAIEIVSSAGETVNTTSGEVARVIDKAQVQELALNGRNYMQLTNLIPGAPLVNDDQLELMTSLSIAQPINGSRNNSNTPTVDGTLNAVSGSYGSQINNVGIDFIQEVSIKTSNFSAEYGRKSGAAINVVTRGGTNEFHGSVWEFLRNEKLDANRFFNNSRNIPRSPLRYNNFGWSFGGPIIKDKLFFFGGMEWKYIRRTADVTRTLPTRAERNGDFSFRLRGPDGVVGTADDGVLRDPRNAASTCVAPVISGGAVTTPANRTGCFPGNVIPSARFTADGRAVINVLNAMERLALVYNDTATANNTIYQMPNPFDYRQEIIRLDYKLNSAHSIYGRYIHDKNLVIEPYGTFINSQLPTIQSSRNRPGFSYQIAHTWLITPVLINEARVGASWAAQRIPPATDDWRRDNYGFAFQQIYPNGGRFEESIPDVSFSGGYAGFRSAAASLLSPSTDISVADTLSYIRGAHTLKTGLQVIRNRVDQNARPAYAGTVNFNNSGNANTTNQPIADALLGNFRTYGEDQIDQIGFFRFWQVEAFALDSWKISRRLSIEYGVRYQYFQPTYTQANNIANFDPAFYNPAQAVTILNNGNIDTTRGGNRFNGLVRVGTGVPAEELGRVPNGNDPILLSVPTGAPRGVYQPQHVLVPRVSFAYAPFEDNKTAIRGGFGIFYDRPEGNLIFSAAAVPPLSLSSQYENGNLATITAGRTALAPFGGITVIDPNLVNPYTMNFSLSVQRELPLGVFFETSYVGSLGRHLTRRPDINQASFDDLRANAALPSSQQKSVNALRPYKGFSAINMTISDATSNYHALQLYATKRKGDFTMTGSYTWSKSLSDTRGGQFDNPEDPFNRRFNYGPTDFDRRHILVFTYTYRLPLLAGSNGFVRAVAGGWEASGITRWQTGQYLTPTGNSSIGGRRADYIGGEIEGPKTIEQWFNTAAFANPPNDRRGTAGVGMIEGPGRYLWDLSLRKKFFLTERLGLQFQGDLFNVLNHVNLNNPNTNRNDAAFGTINASAPGRNIQLGLKLTF